jgi:hypothetical protein
MKQTVTTLILALGPLGPTACGGPPSEPRPRRYATHGFFHNRCP